MNETNQIPIGPNTKLNLFKPEEDATKSVPKSTVAPIETPAEEPQFSFCSVCGHGLYTPCVCIKKSVGANGSVNFEPVQMFACMKCSSLWNRE